MGSYVRSFVTAVFVLIALVVIATQLLGYPAPIGYVETGSMEPTLEPGDGFVVVPAPLASDVTEGDVVTFDAQTVGDGGMTTHRIVDETSDGYITRGDANQFDDQEVGEPPVKQSQIIGVAVQIGGDVVVVPGAGHVSEAVLGSVETAVESLGLSSPSAGGIGTVTTVVGVVLITASVLYELASSNSRSTSRSASRKNVVHSGWILLVILLVVSLPLVTAMVVPSGTDNVAISSTTSPSDDPTSIQAGSTEEIEYQVENRQLLPKVVVLEPRSQGVSFSDPVLTASHGETAVTTLELSAPEETGVYVRSRSEHHYLHVLPTRVIVALHEVHPFVATSAITLVLVAPIVFLFGLLVGFRPISIRSVHG